MFTLTKAPLYNQRPMRKDKNTAILALYNATDFGYDKIPKKHRGSQVTIVQGVIEKGQVHDKSGSGRSKKFIHTARKVVEGIADSNSRLPLRDITDNELKGSRLHNDR